MGQVEVRGHERWGCLSHEGPTGSCSVSLCIKRTRICCTAQENITFVFNNFLKIYLFLVMLGLCCCVWAFSSCGEKGLLFVVVLKLLIALASFVVEHRFYGTGLSCPVARGVFPDQGSNSCPLRWQADAKSLQSCPTLCDPRDGSPPRSPIPGILQARTLEWVAISFSNA